MKIKQLADGLNKVVKKEISADGIVSISKVEIFPSTDGTTIRVSGLYGEKEPADGSDDAWYNEYSIEYADGKSVEFVMGMFYQFLRENL